WQAGPQTRRPGDANQPAPATPRQIPLACLKALTKRLPIRMTRSSLARDPGKRRGRTLVAAPVYSSVVGYARSGPVAGGSVAFFSSPAFLSSQCAVVSAHYRPPLMNALGLVSSVKGSTERTCAVSNQVTRAIAAVNEPSAQTPPDPWLACSAEVAADTTASPRKNARM